MNQPTQPPDDHDQLIHEAVQAGRRDDEARAIEAMNAAENAYFRAHYFPEAGAE